MDKDELRAALRKLNMTCEEFSDLTGWSARTIYAWGERSPVPHPARLILELLAERNGIRLNGRQRLPAPAVPPPAQSRADRFRIG